MHLRGPARGLHYRQWLGDFLRNLSRGPTHVLVVEGDSDSRSMHAAALERVGYEVVAVPTLPPSAEVGSADVILADYPTFEALQHDRYPGPIVVVTDDVRAGVTACLCGAADWVPVNAASDYVTEAVKDAATRRR